MYDVNNVFAQILKGKVQANKIYEDQNLMAFYDLFPVATVHDLVIPKKQYTNYTSFVKKAPKEEVAEFFMTVDQIAKLLQLDSYRLIMNQGASSGQSIFHFHLHIIGGQEITKLI